MQQQTLTAYQLILKAAQEKALKQSQTKKPSATPSKVTASPKIVSVTPATAETTKPIFAFRQPFDLSALIKETSPSPELSDVSIEDILGEKKQDSDITIVDYSEKAIAVIGNTKPKRDILKQLGGKFNPYLKCGEGWIFAKFREADVRSAFNL